MHFRTPPSHTRADHPTLIYAFSKWTGLKGSTFHSRLIHRITFRVSRGVGDSIRAVRYAGCYWPIYEPEVFADVSARWVRESDLIYDPECNEIALPLAHPFLFECDGHMGPYDL